mmetsp:Transcript_29716/g.88690  ORF Transcript_29716/g.88690 Transcript_29716/m.88690 type:complete len:414 (-) Transcript_29716:132-1373(-)
MRVVPRGIALSLPRRPPLPRRHLAHRLLLRRRRRHLRRQGGAVRARARRGGGRPLLGRGGLRTAHARLAVRALPLLGPLLHVADGVRRRPARDHRPRVRALHHRAGDGRVLLGHHLLPRRAVHQPARRGAAEVRLSLCSTSPRPDQGHTGARQTRSRGQPSRKEELRSTTDVPPRYDCEKKAISEFASFQLLPPPMSARLHDYHAFHFAASRDYDVERVAGLLPPALRGEIYLHLHEGLLRQVPIFHRADKRFIQALAKALRPQVLLAGDYAFNACELGDAAFFIDKGVVQLLSAEGSLADTLSPGGYFGETALLGSKRRAGSARAASNCVLFSLSAGAFQAALGEHPEQRAVVERAIEAGRDHSAARRWDAALLTARRHSTHSDARRSSDRLRAEGRGDEGEESKDAPDAAT